MTPTDQYGHWIGLAFLALALLARLAWRAKWRRDDRRAKALAAGIADERRISLMEPDPTPYEDEITEQIPVVTLREESIPTQWVSFGPRWLHKTCLEARRDGRRPCAECAPHLVTGAK